MAMALVSAVRRVGRAMGVGLISMNARSNISSPMARSSTLSIIRTPPVPLPLKARRTMSLFIVSSWERSTTKK